MRFEFNELRNQYEEQNLGGFEMIYPLPDFQNNPQLY